MKVPSKLLKTLKSELKLPGSAPGQPDQQLPGQNLKLRYMSLVQLKSVIEQSQGKWSATISDIDYIFLKVATEHSDDEERANRLLESQLQNIDLPEEDGLKRKWLKTTICRIANDPETLIIVSGVELADARNKLLGLIIGRIMQLLPALNGYAFRILERAVVFLLKLAFKEIDRGNINWCSI